MYLRLHSVICKSFSDGRVPERFKPAVVHSNFRRNATHCISPIAIVVCVCVCVDVYLSVCVCMPRLWTLGIRFEIETSFF